MSPRITKRRVLVAAGVLCFTVLTAGLLARLTLTGLAVNSLLHLAGASEIKFNVAQASPWRVVVEDIGFQLRTQEFAAKRVTFAREHWWMPSLGAVRVEQARVPLTIDGSDTNPWQWATYKNGGKSKVEPWQTPVDQLSVDGQLVIKAAGLPEQELKVKIEARQVSGNTWEVQAEAAGPGLGLQGQARYDPIVDILDFKVPVISLQVKPWQDFVQKLFVLPGGAWDMDGKFTADVNGRFTGKQRMVTANLHLREGRLANVEQHVTAEGIEADLEFTDLPKLSSKPGRLRVHALRPGQLVLNEISAEFVLVDNNQIAVSKASFKTLGGKVGMEPFNYFHSQRDLETVVLVEGISIAEVMALTQDLPAKATGRVNGRFPIRIDDSGLRLGTGWLQLMPGVQADIQFNTSGLLTGGVSTKSPSYAVLKKIESGLLQLKISELRLDIRPPDAPAGRSAQLHIAGEPIDPNVKAPVILDLNVNGPLEKLINLGLDSRLSFGSKP